MTSGKVIAEQVSFTGNNIGLSFFTGRHGSQNITKGWY